MAKERISRSRKRELEEPDEFITLSSRIIGYATTHSKQFVMGLILVLVITLVLSGLRYYSIQTEKKAAGKLEKILAELEKSREVKKTEEVFKTLRPQFESMMADFPRKDATKAARLFFANLAFRAEDFSTALELYEQARKDYEEEPFYRNLVLKNLSTIFEQKKDYAKAINYIELVLQSPESDMKDETLFNLARLHEKNKMHDKAAEDYRKIIAEFPDSEYTKISRTKIQ
jgi:tetratricopeptide (TPR) repeat protein